MKFGTVVPRLFVSAAVARRSPVNRFITGAMPCVVHSSSACVSVGISARTTSASCLPKSSSTKSLRSPRRRGSSGAMPMRSRGVLLRPDRGLDALESVVPAGAPPGAKAIPAERQRDFVDDDHQVRRRRPERDGAGTAEAPTPLRFMYVCGLTSRTRDAADRAGRHARFAVLLPAVETPNVGEVVDDPPADVVTRALVLLARVAQPDDDFHRLVVARRDSDVRLADRPRPNRNRSTTPTTWPLLPPPRPSPCE